MESSWFAAASASSTIRQFTNIMDNTQATSPNSVASANTVCRPRAACRTGLRTFRSCPPRPMPSYRTEPGRPPAFAGDSAMAPRHAARTAGKIHSWSWVCGHPRRTPVCQYLCQSVSSRAARGLIPARGTIVIRDNSGDSIYHALQVQAYRQVLARFSAAPPTPSRR